MERELRSQVAVDRALNTEARACDDGVRRDAMYVADHATTRSLVACSPGSGRSC